MKIGELLKMTRTNIGWTQKKMSAGIVSESLYSKVERGVHHIDADTLLEILKAKRINPALFFNPTLSDEKNTISNLIANKIINAVNRRDIQAWQQVAEEYEENKKKGIEYTQWISYALDLGQAWILRSPKKVTLKTQAQVKRIANADNWNMFTYTLMGTAFIILKPDEVKYFTHRAYSIFKKSKGMMNAQVTTSAGALAVNFLIYAYIHNFDKREYQETFEFFEELPMTAENLIYRIILKYYQALLNQSQNDIEKYGSILKDEKFFCVLQDDN